MYLFFLFWRITVAAMKKSETEYNWGRILSLNRMAYIDDHTTVATRQVFDISFWKLVGTMIPNPELKSRKWFHFPTYIN